MFAHIKRRGRSRKDGTPPSPPSSPPPSPPPSPPLPPLPSPPSPSSTHRTAGPSCRPPPLRASWSRSFTSLTSISTSRPITPDHHYNIILFDYYSIIMILSWKCENWDKGKSTFRKPLYIKPWPWNSHNNNNIINCHIIDSLNFPSWEFDD